MSDEAVFIALASCLQALSAEWHSARQIDLGQQYPIVEEYCWYDRCFVKKGWRTRTCVYTRLLLLDLTKKQIWEDALSPWSCDWILDRLDNTSRNIIVYGKHNWVWAWKVWYIIRTNSCLFRCLSSFTFCPASARVYPRHKLQGQAIHQGGGWYSHYCLG